MSRKRRIHPARLVLDGCGVVRRYTRVERLPVFRWHREQCARGLSFDRADAARGWVRKQVDEADKLIRDGSTDRVD